MYKAILQTLAPALLAITLLGVSGCENDNKKSTSSNTATSSSSSTSSVDRTLPDITPPTPEDFGNVQVQFPPNFSTVSGDSIVVRGTVLDASNITRFTVNGVEKDVSDLADWREEVNLTEGENTISVVAESIDGDITIDHTIYRNLFVASAADLVFDSASETHYILDDRTSKIFILDPATSQATQFSPAAETQANLLSEPVSMVLDSDRNRLIVSQFGEDGLIAVDLTSGEQSLIDIVEDESVLWQNTPTALNLIGTDLYVSDVELVKFDDDGNRLPADTEDADTEVFFPMLYRLDLLSGTRELLLKTENLGSRAIGFVNNMTSDPESGMIYLTYPVVPLSAKIYQFDIESEELVEIQPIRYGINSEGDIAGVPYSPAVIKDLHISTDKNRLYFSTEVALESVTLSEAHSSLIITSNSFPEDETIRIFSINNFYVNDTHATYFDSAYFGFVDVEFASGDRSFSNDSENSENFVSAEGITFSYDYQKFYAADPLVGAVFEWDMQTGEKAVIASRHDFEGEDDENNPIITPTQLAATGDNQLIVFDYNRISSLTLTDDGSKPDANLLYGLNATFIDALYNDSEHAIHFAASDNRSGYFTATLYPEPDDTTLFKFSFNGPDNFDSPFGTLRAIGLDQTQNHLLAADSGQNRILSVDIETGAREYFSDFIINPAEDDIQFMQPKAIATIPQQNTAYILDMAQKSIIQMNMETGDRTLWKTIEPQPELGLTNPINLSAHPFFEYLLTFDEQSHFILAIDIKTEQVVRVSR